MFSFIFEIYRLKKDMRMEGRLLKIRRGPGKEEEGIKESNVEINMIKAHYRYV
jgi:hypothetical protein